jgi:hypothetical protein
VWDTDFVNTWIKATKSTGNGNCVELMPVWLKASRSLNNGMCVEVAPVPSGMLIRDSKKPEDPPLATSWANWGVLLSDLKAGHLDL